MSSCRLFSAILLLSCLACATRSTRPPGIGGSLHDGRTATLTIEVYGLESDNGSVAVALYDSPASFDQRTAAVASETLVPKDRLATWTVGDLPAGVYAVAVYHDLNDNGELDRKTPGPPSEPYGFSNDARGTFGPPKFSSAAIELQPGERIIRIRVR